jgi:hypothetical protein
MKKILVFSSLCVALTISSNAQRPDLSQRQDTSGAKKDGPAKAGPKAFSDVITKKAVSQKGVFNVHFQQLNGVPKSIQKIFSKIVI